MDRLILIANLIKKLLESYFGEEANYSFEVRQDWLLNIPKKALYLNFWNNISDVYSALIDNMWTIDERLLGIHTEENNRMAKIDIWFSDPYNFICEFDEKQHFNQYRLITLEKGYKDLPISFDYNAYLNLSRNIVAQPGEIGFTRLRTPDPLFPPMYEGEAQDNRTRQRAFRDYLKDIVPVRLGFNPTVRISYKVTNGRTRDFSNDDLNNIRKYLYDNNVLDKIKLKK